MRLKATLTFYLFLFSIYSSQSVYSEIEKYAFISGNDVNVRAEPDLNANINGKVNYGEFVDIIKISTNFTKVDNDNFNWYQIKTQNNLTGWVYGKYLLLLSKKPETDKYYKDYLLTKIKSIKRNNVLKKFQVDRGRGIVIAEIDFGNYNDSESIETLIFKMDGKDLIFLTLYFRKDILLFYKNYFIKIAPSADIEVFDMNIINEDGDMFITFLSGTIDSGYCFYKKVFRLYLGDIEEKYNIHPRGNSFIEFDKNKMECIINVRKVYSKDKEQNIIDKLKFKFEEGRFIKVSN